MPVLSATATAIAPAAPSAESAVLTGPGVRLVRRPADRSAPLLDATQRCVVEHAAGPLLVLAGPGTGKTTTLVEAVVERVRRGTPAEQLLVLTFSRKAAADLRDRVLARLPDGAGVPHVSTFHAFCYALLRREQPTGLYTEPLRLLSAPEQDVRITELLAGSVESGTVTWPPQLGQAVGTRGFAEEVRSVLTRARELSLEPDDLVAAGRSAGRLEWQAVGAFMAEYLDVMDSEAAVDYAELVHRVLAASEEPALRARLRREFAAVFVDEFQDTDPAQVRLLTALAGDGRDLVAVGDPDQSIYAFRGADVRGILNFPDVFRTRDGAPAPVVALGTTRRFGPALLAASRAVVDRLPAGGHISVDELRRFRSPVSHRTDPGALDVLTFDGEGSQVEHVADLLRRAHLMDGLAWSEMAVLVRSGQRSLPSLRRALSVAGVPVEVAGDEVALRREPAVAALLLALRSATDPSSIGPQTARELLTGPVGGHDGASLRRLGRVLRANQRSARPVGAGPGEGCSPSQELLAAALRDPGLLVGLDGAVTARALRLSRLLASVHELLERQGTAEEALWQLWTGAAEWQGRLLTTSRRGGVPARAADRDLDAVCALFDEAARIETRRGHRGVANFLAELERQEIPGGTQAEARVRGDGVRLLTAHRAKGLQWRLVVVLGVQDGVWPDLRRRGSLLEADRLARTGLIDPPRPAQLLAEERRLFYVAVTRARERLVITAVRDSAPDGDQPSRFLGELGVEPMHVSGRPRRPLSLSGLVAELRAVVVDDARSPALRQAAAARLALLAERAGSTSGGRAADPARWWGLAQTSAAADPVRPPGQALQLSASTVSGIATCPRRWFLNREARAEVPRGTAMGVGSLVHALAEQVARGRLPADAAELSLRLEQGWGALQHDSRWVAEQDLSWARDALARFVTWHRGRADRLVLAAEYGYEVEVPLSSSDPASSDSALLRGSFDRVESDADGLARVVDLKTGKTTPTKNELVNHVQLRIYQLAVLHGALDGLGPEDGLGEQGLVDPRDIAGAELVQLRQDDSGMPKVQSQPALSESDGRVEVQQLLDAVAAVVRDEDFTARPGGHCVTCEHRLSCPALPEGREVTG